jgi:hypothetical protein
MAKSNRYHQVVEYPERFSGAKCLSVIEKLLVKFWCIGGETNGQSCWFLQDGTETIDTNFHYGRHLCTHW